MAFIIFIFLVAAAISTVAAWFSLAGMGALFAATFWGVVIMAGTLEVGKIVATKWVHTNWRNPRAPWYFRGLFCVFIAALMTITSLGIYGYLSKGHLEQSAPVAGLNIQVAQFETQLKQKQTENDQLQKRLDQISRITDKSLETSGRAGLRAARQQKTESAAIQTRIDENNKVINDLNAKLVPLKTQGAEVEAKLGPVKYVAELFGWDPESAVRIIICIIMIAFDPLALSLFIAGSISLKDWQEARKSRENIRKAKELDWSEFESSMPLPPEDKPTDAILDQMTSIEGEGASTEPREDRFVLSSDSGLTITKGDGEGITLLEGRAESIKLAEPPVDVETLSEHIADILRGAEEPARDFGGEMDAAREAFEKERAEFDEARAQLEQKFIQDAAELDKRESIIAQDNEALQNAHTQLMDMEARLNDEREILKQWEDQLAQQQEAINEWSPEDPRDDKDKILAMLEKNPQVVNDIIETVDAMRHLVRPGL